MGKESYTRKIDLSKKFMDMGVALNKEGIETNDVSLIQIGGVFILCSALIMSQNDLDYFNELVSMFSAKKLLDEMAFENNDVYDYIKNRKLRETFDQYNKRIKKNK